MIGRIRTHQEKMEGVRAMIRSTLEGTARTLKDRLKSEVDRFFDSRYAETIGGLFRFIDGFSLPAGSAAPGDSEKSGFHAEMYQVYSEFKRSVDRYMAETVNPEIIRFVREAEKKIRSQFGSVTGPYDVMLNDVLDEYNRTLDRFGISPVRDRRRPIPIPDVDAIRQEAGVSLPTAEASLRYSARIRSDAMVRLGLFSFLRFFKKLIMRSKAVDAGENRRRALAAGLSRLKAETRESILFHFKDYRENLKYQYLFKLVDAATGQLNGALIHRFGAYEGDLSKIVQLTEKGQGGSARLSDQIEDVNAILIDLQTRIDQLRERIAPPNP
jgi:hypothetical protein